MTTKSVIAEQIYPIMTPLMTNMDILWTFFATRRTNPMEIIDPMKAAIIIAADPIEIDLLRKKIIRSATTSLAPEEIPSTKGPAIGLLKNV